MSGVGVGGLFVVSAGPGLSGALELLHHTHLTFSGLTCSQALEHLNNSAC